MNTAAIIEGLTILQRYRDDQDGYDTSAEHDEIFAHATDVPVESGNLKRLVRLGWIQPDVDFGEGDFKAEHYDPEEPWVCYV